MVEFFDKFEDQQLRKLIVKLFILAIFIYLVFQVFSNKAYDKENYYNFRYREDYKVVFNQEVYEKIVNSYDKEKEYMYCLLGSEVNKTFMIDDLYEEELLEHNKYFVKYKNDPPCQVQRSIGSIHSHPKSSECLASNNDWFAFGEMKNPEPKIAIIHCYGDKFLILKLPDKNMGLDYRSLRWSIKWEDLLLVRMLL